MNTIAKFFAASLIVIAVPACGSDGSGSEVGLWIPGGEWRLDSNPSFELGTELDGGLTFTRVGSVEYLRDGRFLVTHPSHPPAVYVFNAQGELQYTVGRQGDGPGEFQFLALSWLAGRDTIVALNLPAQRLTYFNLDGTLLRTVQVIRGVSSSNAPEGFVSAMPTTIIAGRFADDTYIARPNSILLLAQGDGGIVPLPIIRRTPEGSPIDTIGVFPDAEFVRNDDQRPAPITFGRRAISVADGMFYYTGLGFAYSFTKYNIDGSVAATFERPHTPVIVTEDLFDSFVEASLDPLPEAARASSRARWMARIVADTLPPFVNRLFVATDETVWVQNYRPLDVPDSAYVWSVFKPEGAFLGEVTVSGRFQLRDVNDGFAIGVWQDELDVETVRQYRLIKPDE